MLKKLLIVALAATTFNVMSSPAVTYAEDNVDESTKSKTINIPFENQEPAFSLGVKGIYDEDFPMSVEARWFSPRFDANVQSDKIHYNGGKVGLKSDLGFGNDNAPEFIFKYKRLKLDYIHVHGAGDTKLTGDLTFNDTFYSAGVEAHSQSDFHYIKLDVTNPIYSTDNIDFTWSYGLTGLIWKGQVDGKGIVNGVNYANRHASEEYGIPVPTLGLGVNADVIPQLNVYAQISGLPLGSYGHFYDLEAGVHYRPIDHFGIHAGYRRIEVKVSHDDDDGNLRLSGPFAGLSYEF